MKIFNTTRKTIIADKAVTADSFLKRMVGLLDRKELNPGEGLIITHCQSIHMVFMRFSIDVIFVGKENKVVGVVYKIEPYRFSPVFWKASYAIELPPQTIQKSQTQLGDFIQTINASVL